MLNSHADVIRCARDVGLQLPDDQRIALGVTLIRMASLPSSGGAVLRAERLVGDHGRALIADAIRLDEGRFEAPFTDMTIDTTHGPVLDRHPGARGSAGDPGPRAFSSPARAAWARFVAAERRFSDSIWGDIVAGIGVAVLSVALVMLAGLLP